MSAILPVERMPPNVFRVSSWDCAKTTAVDASKNADVTASTTLFISTSLSPALGSDNVESMTVGPALRGLAGSPFQSRKPGSDLVNRCTSGTAHRTDPGGVRRDNILQKSASSHARRILDPPTRPAGGRSRGCAQASSMGSQARVGLAFAVDDGPSR